MIDRGYMEVPTELKSQWYIIKPVELNLRFYFILSIQCLCSMVKLHVCYVTCSFIEQYG